MVMDDFYAILFNFSEGSYTFMSDEDDEVIRFDTEDEARAYIKNDTRSKVAIIVYVQDADNIEEYNEYDTLV